MTTNQSTPTAQHDPTETPPNVAVLRPSGRTRAGSSSPTSSLIAIEQEQHLIGAILVNPQIIFDIATIIPSPEAFYSSTFRQIYAACLHVAEQMHVAPDLQTVSVYLHRQGQLESVGGREFLISLFDATLTSAGSDTIAALIQELHQRRKLLQGSAAIAQIAADLSLPFEQVSDRCEQEIYQANQMSLTAAQGGHVAEVTTSLRNLYESGDALTMPSGMLDLDQMLGGGWTPGDLVTVAGATGMGKSHFVINAARLFATRQQRPVIIFNCEMSNERYNNRFVAALSGIDSARLINRNHPQPLTDQEVFVRDAAMHTLADLPIWLYKTPQPTVSLMRQAIRRALSQHGEGALIFLDYLQFFGEGSEQRTRELDLFSKQLGAIAQEFNSTFIATAQLNDRQIEGRQNKRPSKSDIRECGAIANHSAQIILLYRDDYYNPESKDTGLIELNVAKSRHDRQGVVKMHFLPEISTFRDMHHWS